MWHVVTRSEYISGPHNCKTDASDYCRLAFGDTRSSVHLKRVENGLYVYTEPIRHIEKNGGKSRDWHIVSHQVLGWQNWPSPPGLV